MDSTVTCRPRVCILWRGGVSCPMSVYCDGVGRCVLSCVCGMAFLCDNTLVKVLMLQAGTVMIWPQMFKTMWSLNEHSNKICHITSDLFNTWHSHHQGACTCRSSSRPRACHRTSRRTAWCLSNSRTAWWEPTWCRPAWVCHSNKLSRLPCRYQHHTLHDLELNSFISANNLNISYHPLSLVNKIIRIYYFLSLQ